MKMEITVEEPNSEQRLLLYMLSLLNEEGCSEALKRVEELVSYFGVLWHTFVSKSKLCSHK